MSDGVEGRAASEIGPVSALLQAIMSAPFSLLCAAVFQRSAGVSLLVGSHSQSHVDSASCLLIL